LWEVLLSHGLESQYFSTTSGVEVGKIQNVASHWRGPTTRKLTRNLLLVIPFVTYAYVLRGEIASVKLGRNRRITPEALDAFIERLQSGSVED
jgi:hypothetical protein